MNTRTQRKLERREEERAMTPDQRVQQMAEGLDAPGPLVAWARHDAAAVAYRRRFGLPDGVQR